ncbi:MAG: hypothetical protein PVS2B2_24720 [Candidatus Acidiferrum sp.]
MILTKLRLFATPILFALAAMLLTPASSFSQTADTAPAKTQTDSARPDRWLHIRIDNKESKGEVVRVNVPIEMAEKILPAINQQNLRHGKVHIDSGRLNDIDVRAILDAVRTSKDSEYVTVQSNENDVRVAKNGGTLFVNVTDKSGPKKSRVEVKIPMKVIDALFSAGKDEVDVVAALHALSAHGDTELVTVKGDDNDIRIWMDAKNVAN